MSEQINYDWKIQTQKRAERIAQRRANWRAFWFGFTHVFGGDLDYNKLEQRFWNDVCKLGGRKP